MRLGLYGGSFDPVHRGHLGAADRAFTLLRLDRLMWVPAGSPPHKLPGALTPGPHREAMLELALASRPHMDVCDAELRRPWPGYTIDTLRAFQAALPGATICFVVGADSLLDLPSWREADRILEFEVAVAPRPGFRPAAAPAAVRRRVRFLGGPSHPAAARDIRARVARGGRIAEWVTPEVEAYIRAHRLYRGGRA